MSPQAPDDDAPEAGDNAAGANSEERAGTGPVAVALSVLAAAFGVQSSRNRQRDFKHGKLSHFVIGGLIGTAVFILLVILMVRLVLPD